MINYLASYFQAALNVLSDKEDLTQSDVKRNDEMQEVNVEASEADR